MRWRKDGAETRPGPEPGSRDRHGVLRPLPNSSCPDLFRASPSTGSPDAGQPRGWPEQVRP